MDEFARHTFRQNGKLVMAALAELPLPSFRNVPTEPVPDVPNYSVLSRGVALVRRVDGVRANAEAWETGL